MYKIQGEKLAIFFQKHLPSAAIFHLKIFLPEIKKWLLNYSIAVDAKIAFLKAEAAATPPPPLLLVGENFCLLYI